jgi:hypothetical protein
MSQSNKLNNSRPRLALKTTLQNELFRRLATFFTEYSKSSECAILLRPAAASRAAKHQSCRRIFALVTAQAIPSMQNVKTTVFTTAAQPVAKCVSHHLNPTATPRKYHTSGSR